MVHPVHPQKCRSPRRTGSALLLVLGLTFLITVVVLAFFSKVTVERNASHSQATMESARTLAGNAIQLVIGKIADGTSGGTAAVPLAWASQPGMIRTYDTSGNTYQYHKLYSSGTNMTVTSFALTDDLPPATWKAAPGVWVDLNAPVTDSTGTLNYPILDPAAINGTSNGNVKPDGFAITNPPGYASGNAAASDNNQAPMPVRWLYQLKDGTLVSGTGTGNTTTVTGATAANPIVGRVAFWTDDETCKVNINTAAEGTYWDTPRFQANPTLPRSCVGNTSDTSNLKYPDYAFACYMPAQFEFQRYPGHPAQVALSSVFPNVNTKIAAGLTPRVVWGGSQGGTVWAGTAMAAPLIDPAKANRKALYATLDEYIFSGNITASGRERNNVGSPLTRADIEAAKFFCTANNRCPEVNLFNLPRIACWPVDASLAAGGASSANRTTAYDRLIAFCSSTLNATTSSRLPYYFQRSDAQSLTNDYANIQRNQDLYAYLQRLTKSAVPGFGGSFLVKYPSDRDQILTEIFDYIRCTNLLDPNLPGYPVGSVPVANSANWPRTTNQFCQATRGCIEGSNSWLYGLGQAMPIQIGQTRGFGRFGSIYGLSLVGICTADGQLPTIISGTTMSNMTQTAFDALMAGNGTLTTNQILCLASNMPTAGSLGVTSDPSTLPTSYTGNSTFFQSNPGAWKYMVYGTPWPPSYPAINNKSWIKQVQSYNGTCFSGSNAASYYNPTLGGTPLTHTQRRIQFFFLPTLLNHAGGFINYGMDIALQIQGLGNITVSNAINVMGGGKLFPDNYPTVTGPVLKVTDVGAGRPYNNPLCTTILIGKNRGVPPAFAAPWNTVPRLNTSIPLSPRNGYPYYPFISMPFTIDSASVGGASLGFAGGNLSVSLFNGKNSYDVNYPDLALGYIESSAPKLNALIADPTNLIQQATIAFPAATFPLPPLCAGGTGFLMEDRLQNGNEGPNGAGVTWFGGADLIRTMIYSGDGRVGAATANITSGNFSASTNYASTTIFNNGEYVLPMQSLTINSPGVMTAPISNNTTASTGDFDSCIAGVVGPFINKADEGDYGNSHYYYWGPDSSNPFQYTPNRIMPSPGMFGSLPTGAKSGKHWQTLLFRPQKNHPNASTTIPDHLIMDLFWMPVVEPYALSESFSTAGKVNMNYQIVPFTYISRPTALLAAMKIEMVSAVPNATNLSWDPCSIGTMYGAATNYSWSFTDGFRKTMNFSKVNGTLRQFEEKFAANEIFRSASQICDIYLVPGNQTWTSNATAETFWTNNLNTADNMREKPYANLYAHLTTKSNTFTVHVRAQALQKVPGTPSDQWVEGQDKIVGDERVSSVLERYLDASNGTLPDFATDSTAQMSSYYHTRILSTKRFNP